MVKRSAETARRRFLRLRSRLEMEQREKWEKVSRTRSELADLACIQNLLLQNYFLIPHVNSEKINTLNFLN